MKQCPVGAIHGTAKQAHHIDLETCVKCGACVTACPPRFSAVSRVSPVPIGMWKEPALATGGKAGA